MKLASLVALALICAPALASAQGANPTPAWSPATPQERAHAERILRRTPVIDGHNDLPWEIRDTHANNLEALDLEHDTSHLASPLMTDIPRLRRGHVGAQFWSVYIPAEQQGLAAMQMVREQIDLTRRMIARYPRTFEFADSAADIVRIQRAGRIASMFGMEGGEPINNNLSMLREFRAEGVLYMTLCHSKTTSWADSATDAPRHGGLSPFGEDVVREMNRVGMLVDISHVSADAMRDAIRVSTAPVIFSHSSAFALTHHPRNVPDDVLQSLRQNGGVVMVNFYPAFVSDQFRLWNADHNAEETRQKSLHPDNPDAAKAALAEWDAAHPRPRVTVATVADHVEYIARVAGHDHVGLGSDFDGIPYTPEGLEGVDDYPNLIAELIRRGWSDADLQKLTGGNLLRVLREAERVAARS